MQPLALTLHLRGETILGADLHDDLAAVRGIAALAEGRPLAEALTLVERVCALSGTAHRLVFCMAVEDAAGARVPRGAQLMRVLFAELERMLARLWVLALTARAMGQSAPYRQALELREMLFSALELATGARVYWGVVVPGGVRGGIDLAPLHTVLGRLAPMLDTMRTAVASHGPLGRAGAGLGGVSGERVLALGIHGLVTQGVAAADDLRRTRPYGGYADVSIEWPAHGATLSDAAARLRSCMNEIDTSRHLARQCLELLQDEWQDEPPVLLEFEGAIEQTQASVQGPHGPVTGALGLDERLRVTGVQLDVPGRRLLAAVPALLLGHSVREVPILLASLDLCTECVYQ